MKDYIMLSNKQKKKIILQHLYLHYAKITLLSIQTKTENHYRFYFTALSENHFRIRKYVGNFVFENDIMIESTIHRSEKE